MPLCPVRNLTKNAFIIYHKIIEKKNIIVWKLKVAVKHGLFTGLRSRYCSYKKLLIYNNIRLSSNKK